MMVRPESALRVVVADRDPAFRAAVLALLALDPDIMIVEAAGVDVAGVGVGVDLVLLDTVGPGGGPAAARAIAAGPGRAPAVVALSWDASSGAVREMLSAGATGYLLKYRVGSDLVDVLRQCARGEVVLAVPCAARVLRGLVEVGKER